MRNLLIAVFATLLVLLVALTFVASLDRNVVTMNGYSGATPPGRSWGPGYPAQCLVLPIRVRSYLDFVGRSDDVAEYLDLMARIVPVGFPDCEMAWLGGAAGGIEPPADS